MSPARTSNNDGIDLRKLVHQILLDVTLLRWSATTGGRGLAVISAIVAARREGSNDEAKILDFLEKWVGVGQHDDGPSDAV